MSTMRIANSIRALAVCALACFSVDGELHAQVRTKSEAQQSAPVGNSTREMRDVATRSIPFSQLTPSAVHQIRSVVDSASYFRRMPTETVACDPEMFTFLVRNPEVMVGIWDVMGITRVMLNRVGQYQLTGDDGAGTTCKMDLIFGDDTTHIYAVSGAYKGSLWPKELQGNSIVLIHNSPVVTSNGVVSPSMQVTMDVFLKLDNIGADLIVRSLGPLVNKSADHNFIECVAFLEQVSQVAANNPVGLQNLASRINNLDPNTRDQFIQTTKVVASKNGLLTAEPLAAIQTSSEYGSSRVPPLEYAEPESRGSSQDGKLSAIGPTGRPISTRRSQTGNISGEQSIEPKGDSPTLYLLNHSSTP